MSTEQIQAAEAEIQEGVHERDMTFLFLLVCASLTFVEAYAWFLSQQWAIALSVHASVVIALWGLHRLFLRWKCDDRLPQFALVLGTFLGPFGLGVVLLTGSFYSIFRLYTSSLDLLEQLYPDLEEHSITETALRIQGGREKVGKDTTPTPFQDLMTYGSVEQKRKVISLILRHYSPDMAEVLQRALHDENNSVRVLAATTLVALEDQYYSRFQVLKKQVLKWPNKPNVLLAFAMHCKDYALSNILSPERAHKIRSEAIEAFLRYIEMTYATDDLAVTLANLYLKDGQAQKTRELLAPLVEDEHDVPFELLDLYGRALFQLRDYAALRKVAERAVPELEGNELSAQVMTSIFFLWSQGGFDLEEAMAEA